LIFGASGGIGHLAVQFAKRMGARVLAVASGDDGVAFVRGPGADKVVDGIRKTCSLPRASSRPTVLMPCS
jgi:NADPH:quinone reductase